MLASLYIIMINRFLITPRAYDNMKSRPVVVKTATPKLDPRRMKIEQMVLTLLRGKVNISLSTVI